MRHPPVACLSRILALREFDDQNGVLGRQTDQHHESDLRVDIVLDLHHEGREDHAQHGASQPQQSERAEHRDRRAQQYAERQRPAFIERRQDQEDEQKRHAEDDPRWNALARLLFLPDMPM